MKNKWGIGIAAAYITFALGMILFAVHASRQHYDLVSNNYYEQAVKYQDKIDAGHNAEQAKLDIAFNELPRCRSQKVCASNIWTGYA